MNDITITINTHKQPNYEIPFMEDEIETLIQILEIGLKLTKGLNSGAREFKAALSNRLDKMTNK